MLPRIKFDGVLVPRSLIKAAGASLAAKLSAFHVGLHTFNNWEQNDAVKKGFLVQKKMTIVEIMMILKRKKPQQMHLDLSKIRTCTWCQCSTVCLHSHHYPIPKALGGKKTVDVCPNCHYEFHQLENEGLFFLTDPYASEIDDYISNNGGEHVC